MILWVRPETLPVRPVPAEPAEGEDGTDRRRAVLRGQVLHVVDGDTLLLSTGRGNTWVRLAGVDAAEKGRPGSPAAHRHAIGKAELEALVLRRVVWCEWDRLQPTCDRFGRAIMYLARWDDGHQVNRAMILRGAARAWRRGTYSRRAEFEGVEALARWLQVGVWGLG